MKKYIQFEVKNMKRILIVLSLFTFFIVTTIMKSLKQQPTPNDMTFEQFQIQFDKKYSEEEKEIRKQAFYTNQELAKQNCKHACGVTQFSDYTPAQLKNLFGSNLIGVSPNDNTALIDIQVGVQATTVPTSFDWRNKSAVTPVKNQGNCGSCWAFAAVAQIESDMVIRGLSNNTIDLAEQILLDCDNISQGCNGGNCLSALSLVFSKGLSSESTYPYNPNITNITYPNTPGYTGICTASNQYSFSTLNLNYYYGTKLLVSDTIKRVLIKPVIVYVVATSWPYYAPTSRSQVLSCTSSDSTSTSKLNHAVIIVGYTSTYWIVKNSWGTRWGMQGYGYISNNPKSDCGIGFFVAASQ